MDRADARQQQEMEEERLQKTMDALDEVYGCGLHKTASFLARELGVTRWWKPERPTDAD